MSGDAFRDAIYEAVAPYIEANCGPFCDTTDIVDAIIEMPEVIELRAEIDRLRVVIKNAASDLYRAEVHRQGVGWDDFCTSLLVRSQHALAAETAWLEARRER